MMLIGHLSSGAPHLVEQNGEGGKGEGERECYSSHTF